MVKSNTTSSSEAYSLEIEEKWQRYWEKEGLYRTPSSPNLPTCYVLDMFPYPSGAGLHVGHPLGYIATDIYARYKRMKGYAVLHPIGFDAFGLPAEQYAIETGQHPSQTTEKNITRYKKQLRRLGLSFDWDREIRTSEPSFYKWTQWMFGLFFQSWYNRSTKKAESIDTLQRAFAEGGSTSVEAACGNSSTFSAKEWNSATPQQQEEWLQYYRLAYLDEAYVNWCPTLGTVLSNDEVKEGYSERGGYPVVQRRMKQWMLRITAYADRLLNDMELLEWPKATLEMQRHWIGRSKGTEINFQVEEGRPLCVFTTREDTIYGVTFICVSVACAKQLPLSVEKRSELQVFAETHLREPSLKGLSTGIYARHPLTKERLPIWVANYVLEDYGTGAVMAVPAHDSRDYAFAKKYNLPIRQVIETETISKGTYEGAYEGKSGHLIASGPLTGLSVERGKEAARELLSSNTYTRQRTNYRLRDAIFARQRYWGEPVPVYYKDNVPYLIPNDQLPLELPEIDAYLPTEEGDPPLARAKDWQKNGLPYEQSTMPGWAGSSWYFFRYMDPRNKNSFCSSEALRRWKQVDLYVGGSEHAVGHLLYARFWTKFLYDKGLISVKEFAKKLTHQGMIYGRSYFVYRVKGKDLYVSKGLRDNYDTVSLHVENELVSSEYILNTSSFCESRSSRKKATFVMEEGKYYCGTEIEKMSKSKHNVVSPDELILRYGADTLRLYEMFLGPLEQSKPWDTRGMDGPHRFLKKVWRLFHSQATKFYLSEEKATEEELRILHKVIQKVSKDTEMLSFNTSVSAMMIAVNELQTVNCHKRKILELLLLVLAPYVPHIAEELWHKCGHRDSVATQTFPLVDTRYLSVDTVTYPVSINGKVRTKIELPASLSVEEIKSQALSNTQVQHWLSARLPKKIIVVPGRIVNFVV